MKLLISYLLLASIHIQAYSQRITQLTVGNTVPDLEIQNIVNYKSTKISLSELKGKLVILDFWATWCAPCISAFPKLDSLQKRFTGKVEILPVSAESKSIVTEFLSKMGKVKKFSPPSVTNDELLGKLFPHNYLPHYVWIDDNRKVVAITDAKEVNEDNITQMLNREQTSLPIKKDAENFVLDVPSGNYTLFGPSIMVKKEGKSSLENLPVEKIGLQTLLTRYTPGLYSMVNFTDSTQVHVINMTIRNLYRTAFSGNSISGLNTNTVVIEVPDSTLYNKITTYRRSSTAELLNWLEDHGYCYTIKVPPAMAFKKYDIMLRELNDYFGSLYGIEGNIEPRISKYLALIRLTDDNKFASMGGDPSSSSDKLSLKIQNSTFNALVSNLALPLQKKPPIFDETGYSGRIDLELNCQLSDLEALNIELGRYGLQLVEKEKPLNVVVIKMKK